MTDQQPPGGVTAAFCKERALQGASRVRLSKLLRSSMHNVELTAAQEQSLRNMESQTSVVVVTGQQIGLLGGPMYAIMKVRTAVEEARRISIANGVTVVPVFWLEDNDHDAAEAATTTLLGSTGKPETVCVWDGTAERVSNVHRTFDARTIESVHNLVLQLSGQFAEHTQQRLLSTYKEGVSWADAFMEVLQPYLGEWGVVVLRASEVIASGLHIPILMKDAKPPGTLAAVIAAETERMQNSGEHVQAKVGSVVFFGSDEHGRAKLRPELIQVEHMQQHPQQYTPNVLSRPLVQDAVLPTVETVLGGAEMYYHHQIRTAYTYLGIPQPLLVRRNGITIVDPKTQRLLEKDGHPTEWFFVNTDELEKKLSTELSADVVPDIDEAKRGIETALAPFLRAAEASDPTLIATVNAQISGMKTGVDTIASKLRAAAMRKSAAIAERARNLQAILHPNGILQERVYPLAFWEARIGINTLRIIVEHACSTAAGRHSVVHVSTVMEHTSP